MSDIIRVGQIWREVDPRAVRHVRVLKIGEGRRSVLIRTVYRSGDGSRLSPWQWDFTRGSRTSWCDRERFNGKRGGYALFEEAP